MSIRNYRYFFVLFVLSFAQLANCSSVLGSIKRSIRQRHSLLPVRQPGIGSNGAARSGVSSPTSVPAAPAPAVPASVGSASDAAPSPNTFAANLGALGQFGQGAGAVFKGLAVGGALYVIGGPVAERAPDIVENVIKYADGKADLMHGQAGALRMISNVDPEDVSNIFHTVSQIDSGVLSDLVSSQAEKNIAKAEESRVRTRFFEQELGDPASKAQMRIDKMQRMNEEAALNAEIMRAEMKRQDGLAAAQVRLIDAQVGRQQAEGDKARAGANLRNAAAVSTVAVAGVVMYNGCPTQ